MKVEALLVLSGGRTENTPIAELVTDQRVSSVHSDVGRGSRALGMWVSGEAIIA